MWRRVIEKEMQAIDCAFEFKDDIVMLPGYLKINCHMVFDVLKMTLKHKAHMLCCWQPPN